MENPSCWTDSHRKIEAGINSFIGAENRKLPEVTFYGHDIHSSDVGVVYRCGVVDSIIWELWPRLDHGEPSVPTDPDWVIAKVIAEWNENVGQGGVGPSLEHGIYMRLKDLGFPV
jgi:hypothetical protein